jgi:hypothetical protein
LADFAWNGFNDINRQGTHNIQHIISECNKSAK